MLTLYSTFKPFVDERTRINQRNAIKSWLSLDPVPEILIFGDGLGVSEICDEFHLKRIASKLTETGVPYLPEMMLGAEEHASNDCLLMVSSDILLTSNVYKILNLPLEMFCIVCTKMESSIFEEMEFDKDWSPEPYIRHASLPTSGDFFLTKRGFMKVIPDMPPFMIGRSMCDSWLFSKAIEKGILVDATEALIILHQNHEHTHIKEGEQESNFELAPEVKNTLIGSANWGINQQFTLYINKGGT